MKKDEEEKKLAQKMSQKRDKRDRMFNDNFDIDDDYVPPERVTNNAR